MWALAILLAAGCVLSMPQDPYLNYQPHYAFSLPVQILLNGIITALVAVLLIQLLFTAPYHWPLAKLNFALQVTGVVTLLISLIATLWLVLTTAHAASSEWPYMLDYIAITVPPSTWSDAKKTWWYIMQATTSGIVQLTHIQFLTLLYPSPLEARLVFFLLGPLAVASSGMVFTSLNSDQHVVDLGDAIRNICNSTLSLIFTAALFGWGFFLNRKQAWRTDGGTAAFGAGACTLAIISTSVNFVLIPEDSLVWLPPMLWAVVLWQSFLGWWWWVGSGMGVGEVEDILLKEQKRKDARNRRKALRRDRAKLSSDEPSSKWTGGLWKPRGPLVRRSRNGDRDATPQPRDFQNQEEGVEMSNIRRSVDGDHPSTSSDAAPPPNQVGAGFARFWRRLRRAHEEATIEQVEMRRQTMYDSNNRDAGWGLGDFGLREREEAERRIRDARKERHELLDDEPAESGVYAQDDGADDTIERVLTETSTQQGQAGGEVNLEAPASRSSGTTIVRPVWALWWWGPLRRWRLQDTTKY